VSLEYVESARTSNDAFIDVHTEGEVQISKVDEMSKNIL
jgi:hypothetical protein